MQFYFDSGYLKSHNNLDLEIRLVLPLKQEFFSSMSQHFKYKESKKLYTRYLQSMDRATIHHLHDKSLHGFPHICVGSFIQSMNHFFVFYLFILFLFLFYFILFFLNFWKTQTFFFRTQDERIGWMTYLDTLAPPKFEWS